MYVGPSFKLMTSSSAKQNKCYVSCYMLKKIRVGRSEIIIILLKKCIAIKTTKMAKNLG